MRFVSVVSRYPAISGGTTIHPRPRGGSRVSGCDNPGAGEAAAIGNGDGVVRGGARAPRNPGAGGAGTGDAGAPVTVDPDPMSEQSLGRHAAAPALPGDELYVAAEPLGHTAGRSRTQRRLSRHSLGVRQPRQRAAPHA